MCVVSMVMDHYIDRWRPLAPYVPPRAPLPGQRGLSDPGQGLSRKEVEEFRKLLERARAYDRRHGEPDCELEEKKRQLAELAEKLGVKIDFL